MDFSCERISCPDVRIHRLARECDSTFFPPQTGLSVYIVFKLKNNHSEIHKLENDQEHVQRTWIELKVEDGHVYNLSALMDFDEAYEKLDDDLVSMGVEPLHTDEIIANVVNYCNTELIRNSDYRLYTLMMAVTVNIEHVYARASQVSEQSSEHGLLPASSLAIQTMLTKVKNWSKAESSNSKAPEAQEFGFVNECEGCSICLEELSVEQNVLRMPCSHVFHGICIEEWLKRSHYCPLCRFEVPM